MANNPSVFTVLTRQSNTPLYKLPVWLYIRDIIVSLNSCGQQSTLFARRDENTWGMHHATHHNTRACAAGQMQSKSLVHTQVFYQPPLRKEIRRQLDTAPKTRPNNRRPDTAVETFDTLSAIDFPKAIYRIPITVLSAHGQEGRVRLQACLDKEERRTGGSTEHARCSTSEDVDAKGLDVGVFKDGRGEVFAEGFVEA